MQNFEDSAFLKSWQYALAKTINTTVTALGTGFRPTRNPFNSFNYRLSFCYGKERCNWLMLRAPARLCNDQGQLEYGLALASIDIPLNYQNKGICTSVLQTLEATALRTEFIKKVIVESVSSEKLRAILIKSGYSPLRNSYDSLLEYRSAICYYKSFSRDHGKCHLTI